MKTVFTSGIRATMIACVLTVLGTGCSTANQQIHVNELQNRTVIGVLGKPLGTRVIIAGTFDERVLCANPLAIFEVDGNALKNKATIEIRSQLRIQKGVHYRLEGYEAGEFSGPPYWLDPEVQQPFQYHCFFVVTKIIEPKPE